MNKALAGAVLLVSVLGAPLLSEADFSARVAELESAHGGRLGVMALDTGTGRRVGYRSDERFAMCSTFKLALAAQVLARVDAGREQLGRPVRFGEKELLDYAPVAREKVGGGAMGVEEMCAAVVEVSDNTAANLLLESVGGPRGFTAWLRSLGDETTRLDRIEPELNTNLAGDERDTTTPAAMVSTLEKILAGPVLGSSSREKLISWMERCVTGRARLRAGFPAGWRAGDKTGSGAGGATNDLAIAWPPGRAPLIVAVYYSGSGGSVEAREAVLAEVARLVAGKFAARVPSAREAAPGWGRAPIRRPPGVGIFPPPLPA